jgi:hypothetical protein
VATTDVEAQFLRRVVAIMVSTTEAYVRNSMGPALRRQFQIIALRTIAEVGGRAEIDRIRQAIQARHPEITWDRRYPVKVLADNGVVIISGTTVELSSSSNPQQIASLLSALDERAVRTVGLRLEDASWRPDQAEWQLLRRKVVEQDGEHCAVPGCGRSDEPAPGPYLARVVTCSDRLVSVGDRQSDQPATAMSRSSRRQDGARGAAPCGRSSDVGSRELAPIGARDRRAHTTR